MAISINHATKVIFIPQSFLTFVGASLYELDVDLFRLALKSLEDDPDGMVLPTTHRHNTVVILSGVSYARTVEIINGYTIEFEDGQYTVRCVGANHNLADVKVLNQVSLIVGNSAGLVGVTSAADIAEAVWDHSSATSLTLKVVLIEKILRNRTQTDPVAGTITVYDDNGTTILFVANLWENVSATQAYRGRGSERRERLT